MKQLISFLIISFAATFLCAQPSQITVPIEDGKILAENGNADACIALGDFYISGIGADCSVIPDTATAIKYYRMSILNNPAYVKLITNKYKTLKDIDWMISVFEDENNQIIPDCLDIWTLLKCTKILSSPQSVKKKSEDIFKILKRSESTSPGKYEEIFQLLKEELSRANNILYAVLVINNAFGDKDYSDAVEILEKDRERGSLGASNNLALCYETGRGKEQNYEKARELYEEDAMRGLARANYHLAYLYYHGLGSDQDFSKSSIYIERAFLLDSLDVEVIALRDSIISDINGKSKKTSMDYSIVLSLLLFVFIVGCFFIMIKGKSQTKI